MIYRIPVAENERAQERMEGYDPINGTSNELGPWQSTEGATLRADLATGSLFGNLSVYRPPFPHYQSGNI